MSDSHHDPRPYHIEKLLRDAEALALGRPLTEAEAADLDREAQDFAATQRDLSGDEPESLDLWPVWRE